MLTAIRERATGWIAWVIVILITIPFALWGINSYFEGGSQLSVAEVNGEPISVYTYQEDLALQRQNLTQQFGGSFDPQLMETLGINRRVLDNLIDNSVLAQFTQEENFRISDNQLRELIETQPSFQTDGVFDVERYQSLLASNGFSPQAFEQYQRANEVVRQLEQGISASAFVTDYEKEQIIRLQDQVRSAAYALIPADRFVDEIEVTDEDIAEYFERNGDNYQTTERMKVDYIELSVDALAETVSPTEDDIQALYEDTRGRYRTAESRSASHILIAVAAGDSDEQRQSKLDLAREIVDRIQQGEDFAALAQQYSDDPGSKSNGGDLGLVAPGQMVKPFEDAVFSMQLDEVSQPVETRFGYHVIKLTGLVEGEQQPLEAVRDKVEEEARLAQAETLFADMADSFMNMVFEDPDNITSTADELDLPVLTSDWFTETEGSGVMQDPQVRRAAFSELVLVDNQVSEAIEIGFDKLIAVQKAEHEPAAPSPLEDVRDEIRETIALERSQAKVFELGAGLLEESGTAGSDLASWESFVSAQGLQLESLQGMKRDMPPELSVFADTLFSSAAPQAGTIAPGGVVLGNGSYVLYALESVSDGDPATSDDAVKAGIENRLLAREGEQVYASFRSALRSRAEIRIFEDQL